MLRPAHPSARAIVRIFLGMVFLGDVFGSRASAKELAPGHLVDVAGRQADFVIRYNPFRDEYLLGYSNGRSVVGHMDTDGNFFRQIPISNGNTGVTHMDLAYDSNRNQWLYVWRNGSQSMAARFLDTDGNPIGAQFSVGTGKEPQLAFSPTGDRFALAYSVGGGSAKYKVISPDHTLNNPVLKSGTISTAAAFSLRIVYGSVANKFLFAYVRDFAPAARQADIFGRFLTANGNNLGGEFAIDSGNKTQNGPVIGYTPSENRFIVAYQTWEASPPNVKVRLVNPNGGGTTRTFQVATTSAWEVPGAIVFNEASETVTFAWRHGSNALTEGRAREWEVSDARARAVGPLITLSNLNPNVVGGAARPDPVEPNVVIVWQKGFGKDGIHAGIIGAVPPEPDLTPPAAVTDLTASTGGPSMPIDPLSVIAASDESGTKIKENVVDGNLNTYWGTAGDPVAEPEFITVDLGGNKPVDGVELWARSSGNFFPLDYDIDVSADDVHYETVFSKTGAVVSPGNSIRHEFSATLAHYVRLRVVKSRSGSGGNHKVQIGEIAVYEQDATPGVVKVAWTAPGNDGDVGAAASYDLRWSLSDITNNAKFNVATSVAGLPVPQLAGNVETFEITGVPNETQVFVAVKTSDGSGNKSDLSNVPTVNTPGVPPAPVTNLVAAFEAPDSVRLTWTATADDGSDAASGPASLYDLRWSTSPLSASNFPSGNVITVPFLPGNLGTAETFVTDVLPEEMDIYFGIRVIDELGNTSPVDTTPTEPMVRTTDVQAPSTPFLELSGRPGATGGRIPAPTFKSSGDVSAANGKGNATDGDPDTHWGSLARSSRRNESLRLDTGSLHEIVQVKMLSRNKKGFFPVDVEIHTSLDNVTYDAVAAFTQLPATVNTWHTLDVPPTTARYVKVLMTKMRQGSGGKYRAEVAEIEVFEAAPAAALEVRVAFDAPGDNGSAGTATSYDLRYSTAPITAVNFTSLPQFPTDPPLPGGSRESVVITGLDAETTYYFAMTASDGVNTSFISNVLEVSTPGVAPDPVGQLLVTDTVGTTLELAWIATADDGSDHGSGAANHYDLRISLAPITDVNFDAATPVTPAPPAPGVFGFGETHTITGLAGDTVYYLAIRVVDEVGNRSLIQTNGVVMAATDDTVAPAQVTALMVSAASDELLLGDAVAVAASSETSDARSMAKATDGLTNTYWNSVAAGVQQDEFITVDLGGEVTLSRVRLLTSHAGKLFPNDLRIDVSDHVDSGFLTVYEAEGLATTQGIWHELNFPTVSGRYVRMYVTNSRVSSGGLYQARIAEIEVYEAAVGGAVSLTWPSPGDGNGIGNPASYDIRVSDSAINGANFADATPIPGPSPPSQFGVVEDFDVPAPNEGALVHFALTATDESGNTGPVSNDVSIVTTITPPARVIGLAPVNVGSVAARLAWAATGDDGFVGTATLFDVRMSTTPITDANFSSASPVPGAPNPGEPGTLHTLDVNGLTPSSDYYFAMKVEDENLAASPLSNVVRITTEPPDFVPPSVITDLRGGTPFNPVPVVAAAVDSSGHSVASRSKEMATDGDPATFWNSIPRAVMTPEFITLDLGSSRAVSRVELLSRNTGGVFPVSVEIQVGDAIGSGFTTAYTASDLPDTASTLHTFDFTPVMGRYIRINVTELRKAGGTYKARIAEINAYEAEFVAGLITLSFTAPGDDLDVGTAMHYDVRWSTSLIDAGNFHLANSLAVDMPSEAGTIETLVIEGLTDNLIYFAIRAEDEVPNLPGISNVVVVVNPDS